MYKMKEKKLKDQEKKNVRNKFIGKYIGMELSNYGTGVRTLKFQAKTDEIINILFENSMARNFMECNKKGDFFELTEPENPWMTWDIMSIEREEAEELI